MPQTTTYSGENTLKMSQFQEQTRNPSLTKTHINHFSGSIKMISNNSSTGIRKIDRVNNQLVTQSMQNGLPVKNHEFQNNLQNPATIAARRERCESIGQQVMKQIDRNCKTSSPTLHLQSANESRLRKKSKEILKNREKFADLIVVLGIKYDEFVDSRRVIPQVVGCFPDIRDKEFAKKHNYVDNLIWICFPEGFAIQAFEKKKDGELCQMKIFHFIITNQDGDKKYITSILFKLLSLIFQKVILDVNALSIKAFAKHPANYISYINEKTEEKVKQNPDCYLMRKIEFYLSIFFNHLYYCEEIDKDIEIEEIRERSTSLAASATNAHNSRCVSNCAKKRHKHKEKMVDCYFRFRNTKTYGFTLENYSFELLLQCLKPQRILFLITALLLERKIILIKENFGDIALIMESLVSLLNPLKWNFVFITYLTPKLVECLEAPFPYIIGVSRKVWEDQCVMREYPDDIIIYDIDNQELLNQVREELPPLPQPQANVLQRSLKDMLDIKERFIETIQENATKKVSKDKMEEYYWAYAQIRVKQSFFNFFLLTINNYIGYFKNLDEEGNLSPNKKDKQFYDKLSSNDVFDFDNYLNQFEGGNREFMEKLVKTQSFNNFIEETYKNTTPKSIIGFFQTNLEVMIDHSFKKLKKEQNKLLDKTFFNLQNPVKFNIGHMYRQYKKQLLIKHGPKLKKMLQEDGILDSNDQNIDIFNRQDILERLLLQEVEGNSKMQLSILNEFKYDLVTNMPGIQYDQISTYEQMKSQRSDQSQERRAQNKTVVQGRSMYGFEFQQSSINIQNDPDQSDFKSRNQKQIIQSRSGDIVNKSQNFKPNTNHKRTGGGLIYDNFLSMANNKNAMLLSQEDNLKNAINDVHRQNHIDQNNQNLQKMTMMNDKIYQKYRVNSENKLPGNFSLNKTMDVNANQQLLRAQAQTQQQKLRNYVKSSSTRNDFMHSSQVSNNINNTQGTIRAAKSPKMTDESKYNMNTNSFNNEKQLKQQSVLKETLNRKIMHERSKKGLQNQSSEKMLLSKRYPQNPLSNNISSMYSPNNRSVVNINGEENLSRHVHQQSSKYIPNSKIDLMNPRLKKLSRNEERKLAMKKGFMNPQQHESFSLFVYSPNEELNKLALMQIIQRKVESGQLQLGQSKDQMSFSNLLYNNKNNYNSNGSEEDLMAKLNRMNSQINQIQFQKRMLQDPEYFQANDPLLTTINFQNNFIQQKNQLHQSPSVTTELSSIKKSDRFGDTVVDQQEEDQVNLESQSPPDNKIINNMQTIIHPSHHHKNAKYKENQKNKNHRHDLSKKSLNDMTISLRDQSLAKLMNGVQKQTDVCQSQYDQLDGDENLDSMETRPLKIIDDESSLTKTQIANLKHPKILDSESPQLKSKNSQNQNLSFKFFAQNVKEKLSTQNQVTVRKNFNAVNPINKSPTNNQQSKLNKNLRQKQSLNLPFTSTFDNSTRADSTKPKAILNRKRSTPAFNAEKSPTTNLHKFQFKGGNSKGIQEHQAPKQQQQSFTYFKQRPLNQGQKSNKSSQVATTTLDLIKKQKLQEQTTMRLDDAKEMQSLRISPIPNLSQILDQQNLQFQEHQNNSSSGVSDDQVVIQSIDNNRASVYHKNHSSNINPLSSNYVSRLSNKSINQNNEMMFASMSHLLDQDLFEKAHMTINGALTARNDIQLKHNIGTTKLKNQIFSLSQRSSSNLHSNFYSRGSQLSGDQYIRPSQLSSDLNRIQKESEITIQDRLRLNNLSRHSDILSQNEPQSNISICILKNSPRMMSKNISRTTKNTNDVMNSNIAKQNFLIQGTNSIQQSALTSLDTQNMKSILNALKQQIPQNTNQNSQNINVVNIDLNKHKQVVFSPKGMSGQKVKDILSQSNATKMMLRNSSIEEVKRNINMSIESKKKEKVTQLNKNSQSSNFQRKQARSPQPQMNPIPPSNKYTKTLQSQEFNLKDKTRKSGHNHNTITNFQSSDPVVSLMKDQNKSNRKSKIQNNQNQTKSIKMNQSSSKNLKIEIIETQIRDINMNYKSNNSLVKSPSQIDSNILSKSTKNLYGVPSKNRLIEEIDEVNDTLLKIEESKQRAQGTSQNLLESTLTSKSNSNASYQTSPKNISNNHASQQIRGFQSSSIFRTINHQLLKQGSADEATMNTQQMITVRNHEFPIRNHQIQQHKESIVLFNSRGKQEQSTDELDYENQDIIDFPKQMQLFDDEYPEHAFPFQQHQSAQYVERRSKIHMEIDELMSINPQSRQSRGSKTSKNTNKVDNSQIIRGSSSFQNSARRGQSQLGYTQVQSQPLNEINYNQNQASNNIPKATNNNSSSPNDKIGKQASNKSKRSENNVFQSENSNNNTDSRRQSQTLSSDQLPQELGNGLHKQQQRKRQQRHGMTTCFVLSTKDSVQYVRRDLNQDVFCKINSHIGDVDNDPHTPKSDISFRSHEKNSRKKNRKKLLSQYHDQQSPQTFINLNQLEPSQDQLMNNQGSFEITPIRAHSASVDGKQQYQFQNKIGAPGQARRRQDFEEQKYLTSKDQSRFPGAIISDEIDMCNLNSQVKYQILFDDADLKDTDDKFTSRDFNFNRLKNDVSDLYN